MGRSDLTVEVVNISPKVTLSELNIFFSYCGAVENIHLLSNKINTDESQSALVTFIQPYAFQTALLLNEATFAGQSIRVLPSKDSPYTIPPSPPDDKPIHHSHIEMQYFVPTVQSTMQDLASKSIQIFSKTKDDLQDNFKVATDHMSAAVKNNPYISASAMWLSGALDKASKRVSAMNTRGSKNPNSTKYK